MSRIVVRRAACQVDGSIVRITGSSLYSLETMTHRSMSARRINSGSTVSTRVASQRSMMAARSSMGRITAPASTPLETAQSSATGQQSGKQCHRGRCQRRPSRPGVAAAFHATQHPPVAHRANTRSVTQQIISRKIAVFCQARHLPGNHPPASVPTGATVPASGCARVAHRWHPAPNRCGDSIALHSINSDASNSRPHVEL